MSKAVITGASRGIGKAIVEALLSAGWEVWGVSRSQPQITDANFHFVEFDLTKFGDYGQLLDQLPEKLDLLINNAGIAYEVKAESIIELDFDKTLTLNLKVPVLLTTRLLSRLQGADVVNISSVCAIQDFPLIGLYDASKAALGSFMRSMALEQPDVRVINILPDEVDTPMLRTIYKDSGAEHLSKVLQPPQVATAVVDIISDTSVKSGSEVIVSNKYLRASQSYQANQPQVISVD